MSTDDPDVLVSDFRSGVEVHRTIYGEWQVRAYTSGFRCDLMGQFSDMEEANRYAAEMVEDVAPGIITAMGIEPYLKLAEDPNAEPS